MKLRKIILTLLSMTSLGFIVLTISVCVDCLNHGCANDSGMIFGVTPFFLIIISLIRILTTIGTRLNFVYRTQELLYAILIFIPLFIRYHDKSMQAGLYLGLLTFILAVIGLVQLYRTNLYNE